MTSSLHAPATDAEGFLLDPHAWTEALALEVAHASGLAELTSRHWVVLHFMRERWLATGSSPTVRAIGQSSGVSIKELYQLFPKGPAKLAARIAGVPKPHGCV